MVNEAGRDSNIVGVVFTSDKDSIFLAGADLNQLKDSLDGDGVSNKILSTLIDIGQDTFTKIENLKVPTVCAIHGACLGGGYELSLACTYRIASNDKRTKIGLPEVNLGILPAWGGCTRLPHLVGLPTALKVILTGGQFASKPAKKMGMIDHVVHRENLVSTACDIITKKKKLPRRNKLLDYVIPNFIVLRKAKSNVMKKTKGNYPAPLKALEVVGKSLSQFRKQSFVNEKEAFIELCGTSHMKNLLRIFFLEEKSKKLRMPEYQKTKCTSACVVGAGTMGAGISQWLSSRGIDVVLKDVDEETVSNGLKKIGKLYVQGVLKYKIDRPAARDGLSRVSTVTTDVPLKDKDIIIEAIVEKLDVKRKVLSDLEEHVSRDTIIATNTSALSIDEMSESLRYPERFVGIHFFNPVHQMKLVEVVRGSKTSDATVDRAVQFVQQIGKLPVVVKDSPGFVVNRVLVAYLVKSASMLKQGHSMESIDESMVNFGMPMGPFRLMDEIGLDVCYHVATDLGNRLPCPQLDGIQELTKRIGKGNLGKKSGRGFYAYNRGNPQKHDSNPDLIDPHELVRVMVNESLDVIGEGVVGDKDALDFAMIMGTGWAPFRGGPLTHSQTFDYIAKVNPDALIEFG